jgi:hypothetical protein
LKLSFFFKRGVSELEGNCWEGSLQQRNLMNKWSRGNENGWMNLFQYQLGHSWKL